MSAVVLVCENNLVGAN